MCLRVCELGVFVRMCPCALNPCVSVSPCQRLRHFVALIVVSMLTRIRNRLAISTSMLSASTSKLTIIMIR